MGSLLGIIGATLFISAYFLLQRNKTFAHHLGYSIMNFSGAAFMLVSLVFEWNMGALINNGFWIVLSIYGIVSAVRARRNEQQSVTAK